MIEIKKINQIDDIEGFKILIETSKHSDISVDVVYSDLVPHLSFSDPKFKDKYFKFLDTQQNLIKQLKLLEKVKKKIILVYIDDDIIVRALKEYLDSKTRIIRTNIDRTHG